MKKLLFLLLCLSFVGQQNLIGMKMKKCDEDYPEYLDDAEEFLKDSVLEWDGVMVNILSFLAYPDEQKLFFDKDKRKISVDDWLIGWFFQKKLDEITKREEREKLPKGIIVKTINKWISSRSTNETQLEKIKNYCKENNIKYLGGNSSYVIVLYDYAVYIPRTIFCSIENGCKPYNHQQLTRVGYYNWYKHFKEKFELKRFEVREPKVLMLDSEKSPDQVTDDDCVIVYEYVDGKNLTPLDGITGRKFLKELFSGAFKCKSDDAKFLRDNILGFVWCGVWTIGHGNMYLVKKSQKFNLVWFDCEAPAIGGSPFHKRDKDGKAFTDKPWAYPDEDRVHGNGGDGLRRLLGLVFGNNIKDEQKKLRTMFKEFAKSEDPSAAILMKQLQKFDLNNNKVLTKEFEK